MLHVKNNKIIALIFFTISNLLHCATGISCDVKNSRATGDGGGGTGVTINLPNYNSNYTQPFVSTFGDQYIAERSNYIEIMFTYGILTDVVTTSASGTGAQVTGSSSMAVVEAGTTDTGTAKIETIRALRYVPGHESYCYFTVEFTGGTSANSTQWIGLFDDVDGFAVGYNGTTFSLLYRANSVDTATAQTSFNIDKLDGTGPSGVTLDPTKLNIFKISFGWLGAAPVTFSIAKSDGTWYPFHKLKLPNTLTTPSLTTPILPIRAQIVKSTGSTAATNLTIKSASWSAGQVGSALPINKRTFSTKVIGATVSNSAEGPVISLQSQTTFKSVTNRNIANIVYLSLSSDKRSTFRVIKNASLTGASFTSINTNSAIYVDTSASSFSGGTSKLGVNVAANTSATLMIDPTVLVIELLKGDIITITGLAQGASATADIFITYEELL